MNAENKKAKIPTSGMPMLHSQKTITPMLPIRPKTAAR